MKITLRKMAVFLCVSAIAYGCSGNNKETGGEQIKSKKENTSAIPMKNIYDFTVKTIEGEDKKLSEYEGKVLMIVNVASKCGYTKQYAPLEELYRKYSGQGLVVLGFPCNDFGGQEPGSNEEIRTFCENKFDVTFPLFDKVKVLGDQKSPLFEMLTSNAKPAGDIEWNFEKFVISRKGEIAGRFRSKAEPDSKDVISLIEQELSKQ